MSSISVSPIDVPQAEAGAATGPALLSQDLRLVGHVPVRLSAVVGSLSISIERLFTLKKGDVLPMEEALGVPITLMLNDRPIARGELMAVEDHFGVRITELA